MNLNEKIDKFESNFDYAQKIIIEKFDLDDQYEYNYYIITALKDGLYDSEVSETKKEIVIKEAEFERADIMIEIDVSQWKFIKYNELFEVKKSICEKCKGKGEVFSSFYYGNGYECQKCNGKGLEK